MGKAPKLRYKTVWISDIHLGTQDCQAELLLEFLKRLRCEKLYLVGDIVDGWRLKRDWYWPQTHTDVIQKILTLARKHVDVRFIPGNHDALFRDYVGTQFGNIQMLMDDVHMLADGRKLLVLHGDEFDAVAKSAPWLAHIGDRAYFVALRFNALFTFFRRKTSKSRFSLSALLKKKVKQAVNMISNFEGFIAKAAQKRGVDGVVCGHIHHAEMRDINGVLYCNDGDWVESCTALVEHDDGRLEIIRWREMRDAA